MTDGAQPERNQPEDAQRRKFFERCLRAEQLERKRNSKSSKNFATVPTILGGFQEFRWINTNFTPRSHLGGKNIT